MARTAVRYNGPITGTLAIYNRDVGDPRLELFWGGISLIVDGCPACGPAGPPANTGRVAIEVAGVGTLAEADIPGNSYVANFSMTPSAAFPLNRTRDIEPLWEVAGGPRDTLESAADDTWDSINGTIAVTLGPLSETVQMAWPGVSASPDAPLDILFTQLGCVGPAPPGTCPVSTYAILSNVVQGGIAQDFTTLGDVLIPDVAHNFHAVGSSNAITIGCQGCPNFIPPANPVFWSTDWGLPYIFDFSEVGVALAGDTDHNAIFDTLWVDVPGLTKAAYMDGFFTWPIGAAYGDHVLVMLGELRAMGQYAQQVGNVGWATSGDYEFEFKQGGQFSVRIDKTSAQEHLIFAHDYMYIPLGFPGLPATDCTSDPHFDIALACNDADLDLSGSLGQRATEWDSDDFVVTGGGVGTVGNVTFTVPAGGGTLYRFLNDPWINRCTFYKDNDVWTQFPRAHYHTEANTFPGGDGWVDPDHDTYDWASFRYLQVSATPSAAPTAMPQLRASYRIATCTDAHTFPIGAVTVGFGAAQTITFDGKFNATTNVLWFDMGADGTAERPDFKHVHKLEIIFGAEAAPIAWTMTGVDLVKHNANDPDRPEQPDHSRLHFYEPRHAYYSGGLNGVVDAVMVSALCTTEQYNVWSGHERLLEHIHYLISSVTGADTSVAWELGDFMDIATEASNAWDLDLPANWVNLTDDGLGGIIKGYSFDLDELMHPVTDGGGYATSFKVHRWDIARGIPYKPHGRHVVSGGIHGMADLRSACCGKVYRREVASGDPWALHANDISSDGHGYWYVFGRLISRYAGAVPQYWEYRVNVSPRNTDVGRLYPRQWEHAWLFMAREGGCAVTLDADRVPWYAWISGSDILVKEMSAQYVTFGAVITVDSSGDYDAVDIAHDGRLMVVSARNATTQLLYQFYSIDAGVSWTGPTLIG